MRIIIIGRESFNILKEFKAVFHNDTTASEYIILRNGSIIYASSLPERDWVKFMDINEVREEILNIESTKWRSESRKSMKLKHLGEILSNMIIFNRDLVIDELLRKENYYDILCYAC